MTMPHEEADTLNNVRNFLLDLQFSRYKRVPKEVRHLVHGLLRHYPMPYRIEQLYEALNRCQEASK